MWTNGYWNCVELSADTPRGRFKSEYWFEGLRYEGGVYKTALEAARASDEGLYQLGAGPERLHFPDEFTRNDPAHTRKRRHVGESETNTETSACLKSDDQSDPDRKSRRGRDRDSEDDDDHETNEKYDDLHTEDRGCSKVGSDCRLKPSKRRKSSELKSTPKILDRHRDNGTPTSKPSPRTSAYSPPSTSRKKSGQTSAKIPERFGVTYEACKLKTLEFQSQSNYKEDAWTIDELLSLLYVIKHNNADKTSLVECLDGNRTIASINRVIAQMPARSLFAQVTKVLDLRTGDQITIFFKSDLKWFTGIVDSAATTGICCVSFPDGDCKYFALDRHGWKWHLWKRSSEKKK
eukprot:m.147720 g.147720  ORF g.147720 m.147720 type:complete len:349 (+) comp30556_c0_seq3:267-1313(+)